MNANEFASAAVANGIESKTDAEIAAMIQALTVRPLPVAAVKAYFREAGIWKLDAIQGIRTGKLTDAALNEETPEVLRDAIADLGSALFDGSADSLHTNSLSYGVPIFQAVAGLVQVGAITKEDCDGFYAIGGGRPYEGITADDVANGRDAYADQVEAEATQARLVNAKALFTERMVAGGDAASVWDQAWLDSES